MAILFIAIFVFGKYNIPTAVLDAFVFITFLLLYEIILVVTEPYVDELTNQVPLYKLRINVALALVFFPFQILERKMRQKFAKK